MKTENKRGKLKKREGKLILKNLRHTLKEGKEKSTPNFKVGKRNQT